MEVDIKNQLKNKIKEELKFYCINAPNVFSDNTIETFLKTLIHPLDDVSLKLDGLQSRIPNVLCRVLLHDLTKDEILTAFPDLAKVEPYLRKVLFLINPTQFKSLNYQKKGFASFIEALNLNPGRIRFDIDNLSSIQNSSSYGLHFLRVYNLRNIESHQCESWTKKEIYENIESVLIVYIYSTYKNIKQLKSIVNKEPDLTNYLRQVVNDFELWQNRFVHITGKEKFEEIDLYAIESDEFKVSPEDKLREGKIDNLRKSIEENRMVILGDPGMGKSTSLQYIAFKDAQTLLTSQNHPTTKIPIYIELKLISRSESIVEFGSSKLKISQEKFTEFLLDGKVSLYLDGLNEVLNEIRKPIRVDIQNLINDYPKTLIIVTSRPLAYSNEFKNLPVFVLQRLENNQVEEFLEKNCSHNETKTIILSELHNNPRIGRIIRVPLLLKMLINVVWMNKGAIPSNKVQIIKIFIQGVYEREKRKHTSDVDFRIIHRLLCFLGYKTREMTGSNVGCRVEEFEAILEKRIEESRFTISVYEFLDFAVDLNLLVKDHNKYSFIHELYQEYYASEEFYRMMAKTK